MAEAREAAAVAETLFASRDLLVRRVARGLGTVCFVTFDSYTDRATLDRPGFGEHHFATRGVDAIHVLSRTNRWYQYSELPEALAAVARATAGYGRVVAYGSSMGGYAALTYGSECGARAGLALSPQFSVDGRVAPFEWRWPDDRRAIRFRNDPPRPLPWQAIVYDPYEAEDRAHAALFAARSPTLLVPAPHGGHPVGGYLVDVGAFAALLDGAVSGELDASRIGRMMRDGKRRSAHYHFVLSRRLGRHHGPARVALARAAVALRPDDAALLSHLGVVLDETDATADARPFHDRALALPTASHHMTYNLALHHERTGEWRQALSLLDMLRRRPGAPRSFHLAWARLTARRWGETRGGRLLARLGLEPLIERAARLVAGRR